MPRVTLLGPQRHVTTIGDVASELGWRGPVAVITAGWEEREDEDAELVEALGLPTRNLRLFARSEQAFAEDPALLEALRQRHDRLRALRRLYRRRLHHALEAARELFGATAHASVDDGDVPFPERPEWSDPTLIDPTRAHALRAVAELDRFHIKRVVDTLAAFDQSVDPSSRPAVRRQRDAIAHDLAGCEAIAIAGGHVTVLLNRLRLFGFDRLVMRRPIMAWSAGAMALTERVVLFHDDPPQGRGDPEVFEPGLGLCPDVVALPHASKRLELDDAVRVTLLARRFTPATCVALDPSSRVDWDGQTWHGHGETRGLSRDGHVVPVDSCW